MGLNKTAQHALKEAKGVLSAVQADGDSGQGLQGPTEQLAGHLLALSTALETGADRRRHAKLRRQLNDRRGQIFSTLLTDRIPRLRRGRDIVDQARKVIALTGIPRAMTTIERLLLGGLNALGHLVLPNLVGEAVRGFIKYEASPFLVPGEPDALTSKVKTLKAPGVRVNVNQLGEEVLGDDEAAHHMTTYLALLSNPEVSTVSVKVSSICAQLDVVAFEDGLERICHELERLYRRAAEASPPKLVMLDMEAYRDLELTHRAFITMLDREEFRDLSAGIVLQAYLPDSHAVQEEIIAWAKARRQKGGAPIAMRLVKGANLAVERIESNHAGLVLPIFATKTEVDASYKLMVERGLQRDTLDAVRLGIASHNLFDVAYALALMNARGLETGVHFEVLSGMAGPLMRTLRALGREVLIYAPAVQAPHLHAAIAYLVRRLDENTADENFLRNSFSMTLGDPAWEAEKTRFGQAMALKDTLDTTSRRRPRVPFPADQTPTDFTNSPETDFTQRTERGRITEAMNALREGPAPHLQLWIAGEAKRREPIPGFDPSRPDVVPYSLSLASADDVKAALECAEHAHIRWSEVDIKARTGILRAIASTLDAERPQLIAALVMDGGKGIRDADAEVSEAIDFATYYAASFERLAEASTISLKPRGVTVITPPWNFPLAIPLGGVFAALVCGNAVILKPARETAFIATRAVELCYKAGLPKDVLQLVVATDEVATELIVNETVKTVVLTGGTETAKLFKRLRPDLHLLAETGGKNATLLSRFADLDVAIDSIIQSAFGHAGQKCSATSLLILPQSLMTDERFKTQLIDAAQSMKVGSAWDPSSRVTPLIHPPEGALKRALTTLEDGESWWLEPKVDPNNPRIWSPGIKAGVKPQSTSHLTEFFGPLLSVMVAKDLDQALDWANATDYGLTAGFHSLDEDDQAAFIGRMDAGNLYINRTTTGAIVQRQPFGGRKASCFGPGHKAGGPNYVSMFVHLSDNTEPPLSTHGVDKVPAGIVPSDEPHRAALLNFAAHCHEAWLHGLSVPVDPTQLRGQSNAFRYQARGRVLAVLGEGADLLASLRLLIAARTLGMPIDLVVLEGCPDLVVVRVTAWLGQDAILGSLEEAFDQQTYQRLRTIGELPEGFFEAVRRHVHHVDTTPVLHDAQFELRKLLHEQTISRNYHRHGHLGLLELDDEAAARGL